jgi:lipoprotein NlpD
MRALVAVALALLAGCSNLTYDQPTAAGYTVRAGDTLYSIAFRHGVDHRELARWNNIADPNRIYVGQRLMLSSGAGSPATPRPVAPPSPPAGSATPSFIWPARGDIVARFGERGILTTGIGIAGALGSDVSAAAPGRVVYAGSGLADYGQLVIIQHNESWLTAYGHNRSLLVSQGQAVDQGQKIAEIGLGPGRVPRLYFEIRRDGDPLDPLTWLPR